jgi:hypothetical protein
MMKKLVLTFTLIFTLFFIIAAGPALAQADTARNTLGFGYAQQLGLESTNADPRNTAVDIVRYLMTFLGIIAVIGILLGGFQWLTAAGNEDRVASAKKTLIAGVIGLVAILTAWATVVFVTDITSNAISGNL